MQELSTREQYSWYTSLAMVPHVSLEMIESLLPLLEKQGEKYVQRL